MEIIKNKELNIKKVSEKYNELIKEKSGRCSKILFFISNSKLIEEVKKYININKCMEENQIITYNAFIIKELEKYWTLIYKEIGVSESIPNLLSYSIPEYIIKEMVEKLRYEKGYFNDITGTSENISKSIYSNLKTAAYMNTDIYSTGEKIYYTKKEKNNLERTSYSENDEIIEKYIDKLLKKSTIDTAIAVYLYTKKLLKNEEYIKLISKRYDYLIIESIENITNSEQELINTFRKLNKKVFIYGDINKDFSILNNFDLNNIVENNFNEENSLIENFGVKYSSILKYSNSIKECYQSQLYTEMIDDIVNKILEISKENGKIGRSVLIVPPGSGILTKRITDKLDKNNINYYNTNTDFKLSNYEYTNILIILSAIYSGNKEIEISNEEYIQMIALVLGVNKIKANKIFKDNEELLKSTIYENEKIEHNIKQNIMTKETENINDITKIVEKIYLVRNKKLKRSEFIRRFYTEVMLELEDGMENINLCKKLISECESLERAEELGVIQDFEIDKILKNVSKDFITFKEIKDKKIDSSEKIMITTPFYYINSVNNRKIQLWADCGNNMWNPKIAKEISNPVVLRKSYQEKEIFTDIDEEKIKKYYMNNQIYSLLSESDEVYIFKSDYSINGYLSDSIMYTSLLNLMEK